MKILKVYVMTAALVLAGLTLTFAETKSAGETGKAATCCQKADGTGCSANCKDECKCATECCKDKCTCGPDCGKDKCKDGCTCCCAEKADCCKDGKKSCKMAANAASGHSCPHSKATGN